MSVCIIPARGGSRRIPNKNKKLFFGTPIIMYTIDAARRSKLFTKIIVSTDDEEIQELCRAVDVTVERRPEAMCRDEVGTQEVAKWVLDGYRSAMPWKHACVMYATSPMLDVDKLVEGYNSLNDLDADYCMSVGAHPLRDAAQWYWGKTSAFMTEVPLIDIYTMMLPVPEHTICDINTPEDWVMAERMCQDRNLGRP